jgi:diaminohydroxyphosphoribosylaminopyrimidine deaminase / 5-amino-6-(5-phosphoribosylamino)uracil reductase
MPSASESDLNYLRRAIRLAMNGRGRVEPNPMVGCVIVKNDRVIGEGYHQQFGGPHAEPNALASCTESPTGATAYVTLEPCCHTDKKTPPCAPKLIAAKIARVVIGCLDPNPKVNGRGVTQLRDAGIQVDGPVLEAESKQLIAPFLAAVNFHRPYVTLKWAESSNGKVAGRMGRPVRITNDSSTRIVHELRGLCDAIAVGTNTVLNDDPLLTARDVNAPRQPLRVILSNSLEKIPLSSRLVSTAKESPVILFCSKTAATVHTDLVEQFRQAEIEVIALADSEGHFSFTDVLSELHRRNVMHLLVEPGPTLARAMIARGHADRVWIFRSSQPIAEADGMDAAKVTYASTGTIKLDGDQLTEYINPSSDVFFVVTPSADLRLAGYLL